MIGASTDGRAGEGDGKREEDPGGNVVESGCGHGSLSERSGEELEFSEDAGEHGESGDGEGDTHEDKERGVAGLVGAGYATAKDERDADAASEGEGDAGSSDGEGSAAAAEDGAEIELEADEEEEEEEADAGHRIKDRRAP